jgi:hypothetical protein
MYKSFVPHPFIERLRANPGFSSADRELIAEAEAHPAYCLVSRACVQRWEAMLRYRHLSRAPAQQWNVYGSGIGLRQRRALLCRGALCAVLVSRLMRFQGRHVAMNFNALHHACCVISRRHFLVALAPGPVARSGPGFLRIFGSEGSSNGQFNYPKLMAWDHQGNVVVADSNNHRLQVIRLSDGACLRTIGSKGSGAGKFNFPGCVAFDSAGHIIVAERDNHRVQVLRYSDGSHVRTIGSEGSGNGQFDCPVGVLIDSQGRIIVSEPRNHRIQVLQ